MRNVPPVLLALVLQTAAVAANDQIVTLGDSLSFAYEAEFCFQKNVTGIGTIGDGMPATTRNWIEILSNPTYRGTRFELGTRDSVTVSPPFDPPFDLYFRQSHNWAIPGLKVDGLRQFLAGQATFTSLIGGSSEFSTISTILSYSNFNDATDFALTDFESQIQGTAERLTIVIGGNDIKPIYGTLYDGGSAGTFVSDFMADIVAILDRVQVLNPNIQIVLANVPHIGITQDVRSTWPYDAVKTERVSAVLRDLNSQLASLAATRQIGFADVYTPTLPMLNGTDLCIQGITFTNGGTATGFANTVWLNGPISDNFHPNTCGQAIIANEIIAGFNKRYQTGIARLSATEILVSLLGRNPTNIDMTFALWCSRFGIPALAAGDSDGDGIPAAMEFALGLSPLRHDSDNTSSGIVANALEIAYPNRIPNSIRYTLTPESSSTLTAPFTPFGTSPAIEADGLYRARLPLGGSPGFLRLKATIP